MGSSISSTRRPSFQRAANATGGTGDNAYQIPTIAKSLWARKEFPDLCRRCSAIDFDKIVNFPGDNWPKLRRPVYSLRLGRLKKNPSCKLCLFFYSMRTRIKDNGDDGDTRVHTLLAYELESILALIRGYNPTHFAPSVVLCILPGKPQKFRSYLDDACWMVPESSTSEPFFSNTRPKLKAFPFSPTTINYPLLRAWCENCDTHHTTCGRDKEIKPRSNKQKVGPAIRCIDCHTREIIEIATADRFFALSYVWGVQPAPGSERTVDSRTATSTSSVRRLPVNIPKVIEDAMIVVASLGERYLWADQYCIDQNDPDDKHAQIGNMAAIYEGAYATIVAFSATDASSGLAGVQDLARKPCPVIRHPKQSLSAFRPSVITSQSLITSSKWMTRGWTYQEAILSCRLLLFTDYQVEFICADSAWHESTTPGIQDKLSWQCSQYDKSSLRAITPMPSWAGRKQVSLDDLAGCIEEYSGRHLSFQSDALKAMTGFLSRVSICTYLGTPCYDPTQEPLFYSPISTGLKTFLFFLTWYPAQSSLLRRHTFPSWSWLGWEGRVTFPSLSVIEVPLCIAQVSIRVLDQTTTGQGTKRVSFANLLQPPILHQEASRVIPSLTNYLWLKGPVLLTRFIHDGPGGSWKECFGCISSGFPFLSEVLFRNCSPHGKDLNTTMFRRVVTEKWKCLLILLEKSSRLDFGTIAHFLILDKAQRAGEKGTEDNHYIAVGSVKSKFPHYQEHFPWEDPSLRRMIKLG